MQWPQQAQRDLNPQPSGSEPDALPIELYASPDRRIRTFDLPDISRMRHHLRHVRIKSERRDLNSQPSACRADTLPVELRSDEQARPGTIRNPRFWRPPYSPFILQTSVTKTGGFEPPHRFCGYSRFSKPFPYQLGLCLHFSMCVLHPV